MLRILGCLLSFVPKPVSATSPIIIITKCNHNTSTVSFNNVMFFQQIMLRIIIDD